MSPATEPFAAEPVEEIQIVETSPVSTESDFTEVEVAEPVSSDPFAQVSFEEKPAKPKKTIWKILAPVIAVVTVIAIVAVCFAEQTAGFFMKTFSSNEGYLHYVEEKAFKNASEDITHYYGTCTGMTGTDRAAENTTRVIVSDDALDILEAYTGANMDLDWINDVIIHSKLNMKGDLAEYKFALEMDKQTLLDVAFFIDADAQSFFIGLLNLSDQYLEVDIGDFYGPSTGNLYADSELTKALPTEAELYRLLNKYFSIAIKNIDDVEKSTDILDVGGISQKVTVLEMNIDAAMAADIAEAILQEARDDKDLKTYINDVAKVLEDEDMISDADEVYEQFLDGIDEALEELDDADNDNEELISITNYIDNRHNIIGREIEIEGDKISYVTVTDGKEFAREFVADSVVIRGEGTKKGSKETAEYTLKVSGTPLLTLTVSDFDTEPKDTLNGKLLLEPTDALLEMMELDSQAMSLIRTLDLGLSLEFSGNKSKASATIAVMSKGDPLVSFVTDAKDKNPTKVTLPDGKDVLDANDTDEAEEWVTSFDFDELINALKKTDLPKDLIDQLEGVLQSIG